MSDDVAPSMSVKAVEPLSARHYSGGVGACVGVAVATGISNPDMLLPTIIAAVVGAGIVTVLLAPRMRASLTLADGELALKAGLRTRKLAPSDVRRFDVSDQDDKKVYELIVEEGADVVFTSAWTDADRLAPAIRKWLKPKKKSKRRKKPTAKSES